MTRVSKGCPWSGVIADLSYSILMPVVFLDEAEESVQQVLKERLSPTSTEEQIPTCLAARARALGFYPEIQEKILLLLW